MSFVSYAQNFEDVLLRRAFRDVKKGHYLDIGAQDPVVDSVSLAFYEAGWRGIHVEPTPAYAKRLREVRPDEIVIEAAVSDAPGPIHFYQIADTGLSTGKQGIAKAHESAGYDLQEIVVPCVRLDELLELSPDDIHWLKIDVEGMEADVLRSWGESERRPWILVIESTAPGTPERTDHLWIDAVHQRGYRGVFFDGLSRYFLHESQEHLAKRFEAPANVFDGFVVAHHHFAVTQVRAEHQATSERLDQEWARAEKLTAELHESSHAREVAREELKSALERLAGAQHERRSDLEMHLRSLQAVEELHRQREELLRQNASEAHAAAAAARADAARFEERASQLEQRLDDEKRNHDHAAARLASAQRERDEAREVAQRLRDDLETQISGLQASLTKANAIISEAVAQRSGRWQRFGEALGFARPRQWRVFAATERSTGAYSPISLSPDEQPPKGTTSDMINAHAVVPRNPYLRANSLAELLSWDDVDFVRCAYVTVLGRQPDAGGEVYYTQRIRQGHSKLEILWQLRHSPEGPRHDPGIAGFDRALKTARWERSRAFGWAVRAFTRGEGNGLSWRRHRALLNALELNGQRMGEIGRQLHSVQPCANTARDVHAARETAGPNDDDVPHRATSDHVSDPICRVLTARERTIYSSLRS